MPDSPTTPGPDPMCFDANAGKWVDAWVHHKPPPQGAVGVMYMLEGGTDASNTDPYATKPTADNDWVKTGPHIMIVGSKEILAGHPSGGKPDTSVPYVMWAGTPYAHLMVPIGPRFNKRGRPRTPQPRSARISPCWRGSAPANRSRGVHIGASARPCRR